MKKIVCDLCGESDFVKTNGFFECQVCGAKYTIEEARSMFIEVEESQKAKEVEVDDTPVLKAKPAPTIVKKVTVAPKTTNQSAKSIVSSIKKSQDSEISNKKGPVVVKKVVVKPTATKTTVKPKIVKPVEVENVSYTNSKDQMIENLFILAQNAYDSDNYNDAENYANRIIEIDSKNCDAWLMKGNCAGKNNDGKTFRLVESINCWNTCLLNAKVDEYEDYKFTVRTNCIDIAVAFVLKSLNDFKNNPSEESLNKIKASIDYVEPMLRQANQKFGVDINSYEDKLASNINAFVTAVSKEAIKQFGKKAEMQTDEAYKKFVTTQDACILAWGYLMDLAKKHGTVSTILNNIVKTNEAIIRNCGHKVSGNKVKESLKCSMSERNLRLENIKKAKKKLEDKFVDIRKRDRVAQKFKNEEYWKEHQEEKQELLDERMRLEHEVFELENGKLKMPELTEIKKLEEEALRLQILKDNPTYSTKDRNQYMEQLNKTRKQVVTKKRELASRLNPIEDKIEKMKKRMFNIDLELNMNR